MLPRPVSKSRQELLERLSLGNQRLQRSSSSDGFSTHAVQFLGFSASFTSISFLPSLSSFVVEETLKDVKTKQNYGHWFFCLWFASTDSG